MRSLLLVVALASAQVPAPQPRLEFDVASVKPVTTRDVSVMRVTRDGIDYVREPLRTIIAQAYDVKWGSISSPDSRIVEMLTRGNYNITAKAGRAASNAELMRMLQTLLVDRFKLSARREAQMEQVYLLVALPTGSRLAESEGDGATVFTPLPNGGVDCRNMTMADFTRFLTGRMGRVVLDRTALTGRYDFTLKLTGLPSVAEATAAIAASPDPDAAKAAAVSALNDWLSSSIFIDIQKQLGLKLDAGRDSVDHLVIDHLERPTAD